MVVRTGAQLPFKILDDGQTAEATSTLGQEPTTGPEALPVPGTSNSSLTTWMWTDEESVPRRTTYAYLQGRPAPRYFVQLGGPQSSWPQDRVDTLLGSLSVGDGSA